MVDDKHHAFASELAACIADEREPTMPELFSLARRVWMEGAAERSAFGWDRLPATHQKRLWSLRAARAALAGSVGEGT